jgi:hypothetical protein
MPAVTVPATKAVRDGARNGRQERVDRRPSSGVDLELTQRTVAVGAVVLLPAAVAAAAVHDAPRVAGAGGAFGEVTAETAAVETDDETGRVARSSSRRTGPSRRACRPTRGV